MKRAKGTSTVLRYCYWCCFACWWIFPTVIIKPVVASLCLPDSSSICNVAVLNTTANGWAQNIVAMIEKKHKWFYVDKALLPASPRAVAAFVQVLSGLTKSLEFRMYRERVLFISQKNEAERIDVRHAPELQELQVQPNDHIRTLYIFNASLIHLPQGLKDFPKLEDLYVSNNHLTQLALASFSSIQKLVRVDVSDNRISLLQATNQTVSIKSLHMENNRLTVVNMEFFEHIVNLVNLYLGQNQIIRIDNTKPLKMSTLDSLRLDSNQLSSFQPLLAEFPALKQLNLYGNNLATVPRNLGKYPLLEKLDLRANRLTRVDLASIRQASKLEQLHLNQNNITLVSASTPLKHATLRHVEVEGNQIGRIDLTGCDFPKLNNLNLGSNKLTSVPPNIFQQFPSVKLLMWGNAMRCDDLAKYQQQLADYQLIVDPLWLDKRCLKNGKTIQVNNEMRVCCTEEAN